MTEFSKLLKFTLIIDIIACSFIGIMLLILPTVMFTDPFAGNMMGGVFLTFSLLNILALRESEMEEIKFIILADICSNTILSGISIIGFFIYSLPIVAWVIIGGATAFSVSYIICWTKRVNK